MKIIKRLGSFFKQQDGSAHVMALMIVIASFMFLAFLMIFFSLVLKQHLISKDIDRAIVTCETQNYDIAYPSLIEGQSYTDGTNYNTDAYRAAFFNAVDSNFIHCVKSDTGTGRNYTVYNVNGQKALDIEGLTLSVSVENMPMPDTKTKRLRYLATGTLSIPLSAFGYTGYVTIPIRRTATYQFVG